MATYKVEIDGGIETVTARTEKEAIRKAARKQGNSKSVGKTFGPKVKVTKIKEELKVSDGAGAWIDDFQKSDAPQFKGKTKEERREMAIAAYMDAKRGSKEEGVIGNLVKKGAKAVGGAVANRLTTTGRAKIAQKKIDKHNTKIQRKDTIAQAKAAGKSAFGFTQKQRAANAQKKLDKIAKKKAAQDTINKAKNLKRGVTAGMTYESTLEEKFTPKQIKMAIGIASDPRYKGGNMTGAVKAIEKIAKGLSNEKQVAAVLKRQNEGTMNWDNFREKLAEAANPAQQAAIAIAKKEKGEKPKNEQNADYKVDGRRVSFKEKAKKLGYEKVKDDDVEEAKQTHMFDNEKDARAKAKEIGGKYVKGTGKSAGKHAAVKENAFTKNEGKKMDSAAMKKAMDAFKKRGGKVTKVAPGKAAGYHGKDDPGKDMHGMMDRGDTKGMPRKKKVKSMGREQVDEVSKKTAGSYVKKASDDMAKQSNKMARGDNQAVNKLVNRRTGIARAVNRLTK